MGLAHSVRGDGVHDVVDEPARDGLVLHQGAVDDRPENLGHYVSAVETPGQLTVFDCPVDHVFHDAAGSIDDARAEARDRVVGVAWRG